jgi:hypothetical protein
MSAVAARVRGLLAQLGDTNQKVVKRLKREKIKGQLADQYGEGPAKPSPSCPIANYLRAHGVVKPRVGATHVHFVDNKRAAKIESTAAVAVFVGIFDDGGYPELVEQ